MSSVTISRFPGLFVVLRHCRAFREETDGMDGIPGGCMGTFLLDLV